MTNKEEVVHPEDVEHPPPPKKDLVAAKIADACSTVEFALVNLALIVLWALTGGFGIDKFPFSLLTFILSVEAILLTVFVLVQQRLQLVMQKRESDADLKNDAIAADEATATRKQLDRIERALRESRALQKEKKG